MVSLLVSPEYVHLRRFYCVSNTRTGVATGLPIYLNEPEVKRLITRPSVFPTSQTPSLLAGTNLADLPILFLQIGYFF